jgi:chorismate mutase/prephenate dehydrogenase
MDISSSKTEYFKKAIKFASESGMKMISTHPLFGLEDAKRGSGIAIITDGKTAKDVEDAASFWTSTGLVAIKMSMDEHEKAMAVSQVLRHAYALGFYDSVSELSNMLKVDYEKACTAKFMQMLENAKAIKSEEWVAAEIAKSNPYSKLVYEIAERNLRKHASSLIF